MIILEFCLKMHIKKQIQHFQTCNSYICFPLWDFRKFILSETCLYRHKKNNMYIYVKEKYLKEA